MTFTAGQRRAVESWERGDICVVAGPGSGKTLVLVERIRWLVETKGIDPARILAITFTEKAARQMLERLVGGAGPDGDKRQAYHRTRISTIDGFCAGFLREQALEASIDPEFKVMDAWQAEMELRHVVGKVLDGHYAADPSSALGFLKSFAGSRSRAEEISLSSVHEQVFRLYQSMRATGAARGRPKPSEGSGPVEFQAQRAWIAGVLQEVDRRYRGWKRAAGLVDFPDLAELAVGILEKGRGRRLPFQHVLVDENQDTNPLQAKLIALLREHASEGCVLFAVGDINQSIYGFRDADPEVFRDFREAVRAGGGEVVELQENFRSRPEILLAAERLLAGAAGIETRPLVARRGLPPKDDPSVEVTVVRHRKKAIARRREGRHVAARVMELRGRLKIGDPARTPAWRDFAVLVRTHNLVREFYKHLREAAIPCQVAGGAGFFEAREVRDFMCLLQVLSNPRDEIRLAAVLCSPLVGVSDETLLRLKLDVQNLADALRGEVIVPGEDGRRLRTFVERLARWRGSSDSIPPDLLIWRILSETGYEAFTLSQPDGSQKAAGVRKLAELSRSLHDTGRFTFGQLVERLAEWQASRPRHPEAEARENAENAVQIMTMHNAKGLEFPIVFLPALDYVSRGSSDALAYLPASGLGVKWVDPQTGEDAPDPTFQAGSERRKKREKEENSRLLYVAMTRAEEHLVLSAALGINVTGAARLLRDRLGLKLDPSDQSPREEERDGLRFRLIRTGQDAEPPRADPAGVTRPEVHFVDPLQPGESADASASVTSIALYAQCPRKYYLSRYLGFESAPGPLPFTPEDEPAPEQDDMEASELGRQVHKILAGSFDPEDSGPEAVRLARNFQESDLGQRAEANAVREQSLLFAVDDHLLQGQIDLWFDDRAERVLIDYKTDQVMAEEAEGRAQDYALQIRLYAQALKQAGGKRPDRGVLYFLRPNAAVDVDVGPGALDEARQTVRDFFAAQSRQSFPLRVGKHCFRCAHYGNLCPARVPPE